MDTSCENCKVKSKDLKRCTGCFDVYYCSKECQVSSWKFHKQTCNKTKQKKATSTQQCQKEGSSSPKQEKEASSASASQNNEPTERDMRKCTVCDVVGVMKFCQRCKVTPYCSKTCQSKDWSAHKDWCKNEEMKGRKENKDEGAEKGESSRSETTGDNTSSTTFSFPFPFPGMGFPFNPMFAQDGADLSLRCVASDSQWERAKVMVRRRKPFCTMIDEISDIPGEPFFGPQFKTDLALLAFISAFHHYRGRHCVYIQDKFKEEIYVAFYLDFDNPFPFFNWGHVRPGRFICIESPFIHYFLDGSIGLRIEDPSDVMFIDV